MFQKGCMKYVSNQRSCLAFLDDYCKYCNSRYRFLSSSRYNHGQANRKRTIKSLNNANQRVKIITTKERIRKINEKNVIESTTLNANEINNLLEQAYSRASYLRTKLFQHWSPNYVESRNSSSISGSKKRPIKQGIVMDGRWWRWNIALALMPATLLALYCEFIGEPNMKELREIQEMQQMLNIMGPEFVEKYKEERVAKQQQEASVWKRINRQIDELTHYLEFLGLRQESHDGARENKSTVEISNKRIEKENDQKIISTNTGIHLPPELNDTTESVSLPSVSSDNSSAVNQINESQIQELIHRIQKLERLIYTQQHEKQEQQPISKSHFSQLNQEQPQDGLLKQLERSKQSGIQNRMQDSLSNQWKRKLDETQKKEKPTEFKNGDQNHQPETLSASSLQDKLKVYISLVSSFLLFDVSDSNTDHRDHRLSATESKHTNEENITAKQVTVLPVPEAILAAGEDVSNPEEQNFVPIAVSGDSEQNLENLKNVNKCDQQEAVNHNDQMSSLSPQSKPWYRRLFG